MNKRGMIFCLTSSFLCVIFLLPNCKQPYCGPPKNKTTDTTTPPVTIPDCAAKVYLPLDGNITDNSLHKNNVIAHGTFTYGNGKNGSSNGAAYFNGTNNYLEIPHKSIFTGSSFAVMAWVNPVAFNSYTNGIATLDWYSGFFNKWDNSTRRGISTYCTYQQSRINGYFANGLLFDQGTPTGSFLSTGSSQHVAYVVSNGDVKLYLNGVVKTTLFSGNTSGLLTVNSPIEIGRTQWYPSNVLMLSYFTGYIDDLKIFYNCPGIDVSKEM